MKFPLLIRELKEIDIPECIVLFQNTIQQLPAYLESIKETLPKIEKPVILTEEYTPINFLVQQIDDL